MLHMELLLRNFGVTTAGPGTAYHLGDADDPDQLYYNGKKLTVQTELERAKAALGVVSERKTLSAKWWEWVWRLPDEDTPLLAQVREKYAPTAGETAPAA